MRRYASAWPLTFAVLLPSMMADAQQDSRLEVLTPGNGFNGIHGLTFNAQDELFAGSVIGQTIFKIDAASGDAFAFMPPPLGMADDLEFGPDGTLAWTSFTLGIVHAKRGDGVVQRLAMGLPGINSIAWRSDGRLFATQVFLGDALYEIDPAGQKPPRKIAENLGGLNGFDFGPDGFLYGPLWFKGEVVRVDVDSGVIETVAGGFETPAAVNFDSRGNLYAIDTKAGVIYRIDMTTGVRHEVATFQPGMDNLAFDSRDRLFVTVMTTNSVYEVDVKSGESRLVTGGTLAAPCDIALVENEDKETLYVSDVFSLRSIDARSGAVAILARNYVDELENPIGTFANESKILAVSWFSGTVQQFDRATGKSDFIAHDFAAPTDAVILPNGDWAVLEFGAGRLVRATGLEKRDRIPIVENLSGPNAMALAADGDLYVTTASGAVQSVDVDAGTMAAVVENLSMPEGIAIASDGSLVVAEAGKQRIVRVDPATGGLSEIRGRLPIGLPAPAGVPPSYTLTGVAVSGSGAIYFSSDIEDAIYKLTPR